MAIELLNIDCMDYMAGLPDKVFDLAIVDPPYGIKENAHRAQSRTKLAKTKVYNNSTWDNEIPPPLYFKELFRVSKNQIIWGGNYFIENLYNTRCMIVWRKLTTGNFADCELAWTSFNTSVREFTFMWNGMLQGKNMDEGHKMNPNKCNNEERIHECQKPVALYKWLIKNYAISGHKLLDTHGGSFSSAIAAFEMGYEITVCEKDIICYNDGKKRFNAHRVKYSPASISPVTHKGELKLF